jgi:hypothetical protein
MINVPFYVWLAAAGFTCAYVWGRWKAPVVVLLLATCWIALAVALGLIA